MGSQAELGNQKKAVILNGAERSEESRIFGGLGAKNGLAVESLYRHVHPCRLFDGAGEIQKVFIARDLLREYKSE
ncbi:MAG: acyl-CoA dehydrogenase family protein [Thermodesulfobacteriota bacterium]